LKPLVVGARLASTATGGGVSTMSVVLAFVCFLFFTQDPATTDHANNILSFGEIVWVQDKAPSTASPYSDAGNLHNRGVLAQEQGRFADAESAFRDALQAWDALPAAPSEAMAATLNGLAVRG